MDRKTELLMVCYQMLKRQYESPYVLNVLSETYFYDGVDCDGYCLMDDIAMELGIEQD